MVRDALRAELNAGVGLGPVADQLELHLQLEVAEALLRAKKLVARHNLVERAPDNGSILDEPGLLNVALPPGEGLSVEERLFLGTRRRGSHGSQQQGGDRDAHNSSRVGVAVVVGAAAVLRAVSIDSVDGFFVFGWCVK